ncbi:hypothetical protein GCM10020254_83000 [Streptomyces goshikiensis]
MGVDIQEAVTDGIHAWRADASAATPVDTSGAASFSTYLPTGLYGDFKEDCRVREVPYNQGVAQSIRLWLDTHPPPPADDGRRTRAPAGSWSATRRAGWARAPSATGSPRPSPRPVPVSA